MKAKPSASGSGSADPVPLRPFRFARLGSISSGTLRPADLITRFSAELESLILINGDHFSRPENFRERDRLETLIGEAADLYDESGREISDEKAEDADGILEDLFSALQEFAPPYCFFGSHPGDGADLGFWPPEDLRDVAAEVGFSSFASSAAARRAGVETDPHDPAVPAPDYRGEWLEVNDHGNATLYVREDTGPGPGPGYRDRELWAIV